MNGINRLIKSIDELVKADDEQLKEDLKMYPELDYTIDKIDELENITYKLLKEQANHYTDGIEEYVAKASIKDILNYINGDLFASDQFMKKFDKEFKKFLETTTEELTGYYLKSIDKDLFFSTFTDRTTDWINDWSAELAGMLQLTSLNELDRVLKSGLEDRIGIKKISKNIKDSYGFSRTRARTVAITEVLTAHSSASFESGTQNPSVDRFNWEHSGARGIKPRASHVALGKEPPIKKGEMFEVGNELARYPRDTNLSAKERVNCHCVLQQIVDDKISGLSLKRRRELQAEAIVNDNRIYHRKANPK